MKICDFNSIFLQEKMLECLADIKKMRTFAPQSREIATIKRQKGAVVQPG